MSDDAFLGYVEQQTFNYFWNEVNTTNGLIRLRSDQANTAAVGAVGFGLSAICIGIDHGWITRDQGRARVLAALNTLYNGPQGSGASGYTGYHGWFYHQLNLNTGFRNGTIELSTSDTAILLSGVIDAGIYFNDPTNQDEVTIRNVSSNIFNRIDFQFMLKTNDSTVYLQWTPESGFTNVNGYKGYNEVAYLYIYGLGAPTNPLPAASWAAWVSGFNWKTYYGYSYAYKAQLFGYQYSHCWIDFNGIPDAYMQGMGSDYFQNSRRATLAQQAYAIDNPAGYPNYGTNEWGYTSCSGPDGYDTVGAPGGTDNGTIAPTAAAGSMPFAPEACLPAIRHLYDTYTNQLWTTEGFRDSFNIASNNFFNSATLAIDEGPIILMIENYRTGSVWNRMMTSPIIQRGLQRAGFTAPPPNTVNAAVISSNQISVSWSGISTYQTGYEILTSSNGVTFTVSATVASNIYSATISWPSNTPCYIEVVTTSPAGTSGSLQTVILNPVSPPTLNPINNLTLNENAGPQVVYLSGITSGVSNQNQTLTVTATSSNTNLIPNPTVNYINPGTSGSLTFTPGTNTNGSATITVTVNNGAANNNIVTQSFTVTVLLPNTILPIYESFNYPVGQPLQGQGGWVTNGAATLNNIEACYITNGNLSMPGLAPPIGNHYLWASNVTCRLPFGTQTNGPIYFSFSLRATNPYIVLGDDAIAGLTYSNTSTLWPKIDLEWSSSSSYQVAIAKGSGLTYAITNQTSFNATNLVFVVGCLIMTNNNSVSTPGSPGDIVEMWVNPDPSTYGDTTPPAPNCVT
ncbi:MAG TPA: glucoamylase family protein, partial [Candidatus Sulfotelmatobacter sp.]|nr:glucoamylase family protein [Candidatus Sulfotelmatobacter sp.]